MINLNKWVLSSQVPLRSVTNVSQLLVLVCVLMLFSAESHAQSDAYSVEVAVADRGRAEQKDAYESAFRRVLINNSGDKTLLNRDAVRAGLKQAETFVASFSYRAPPPGTIIASDTPITKQVRQTGEATQLMMVSFDRKLVRELIDSSAGVGQSKEVAEVVIRRSDSALVWLLIRDNGRDIMISDPQAANVQSRARELAGAAGISLVFPVGDDADKQAVSVENMLNQNLQQLLPASERYEQGTILVGTLARNGIRGWRGDWMRITGEEQVQNSFDTDSLDDALQKGLSVLSSVGPIDESYRYGGTAASDIEGLVWVGSVTSLENYAGMMKFLEAVPSVATVYPKEVANSAVVFAVLPRSSLSDIASAASTKNWLRQTRPPVSSSTGGLERNADLALELGQ